MKYIKFLLTGILFGLVMAKAEIISWYRIYEMFRFESFHMFGIIGSAILIGALLIWSFKRNENKTMNGETLLIPAKNKSITRYLVGGIIFGLGWALSGACPGPMFVLVGAGYWPIILVIGGALLGTYAYGLVRNKLPH